MAFEPRIADLANLLTRRAKQGHDGIMARKVPPPAPARKSRMADAADARPHPRWRCVLLLSRLLLLGGRPLEGRDAQPGTHAGERRNPVFGGYEVGIGFSGSCTADSGEFEGIALA